MVLEATRSVRGTVGMVLEATGGSQGQWGWSEVSLTLPERYKRVVEGHFQLQRWYKGLWEMIYAPPG